MAQDSAPRHLNIVFPEGNKKMIVRVAKSVQTASQLVSALINIIIKTGHTNFPSEPEDWEILVDSNGWSKILDDSANVSNFLNEIVYLRKQRLANIGGRFYMEHLSDTEKFNNNVVEKVTKLVDSYIGYRQIRGDGNCYYRAVIFGLIENLVETSRHGVFEQLASLLRGVDAIDQGDDRRCFLFVISVFTSVAKGGLTKWRSVAAVEATFHLTVSGIDIDSAFIRVCKRLVALSLKQSQDHEVNGLRVKDAIMLTYDVRDVDEFCEKYVLAMNVCAEGPHVDLALLPTILGCESHIVILTRDSNPVCIYDSPLLTNSKQAYADIHLLLRPGHYDLLYSRKVSNDLENNVNGPIQNNSL